MNPTNTVADYVLDKMLAERDASKTKDATIADLTRQLEHVRSMLKAETKYASETYIKLEDAETKISKLEGDVKGLLSALDGAAKVIYDGQLAVERAERSAESYRNAARLEKRNKLIADLLTLSKNDTKN